MKKIITIVSLAVLSCATVAIGAACGEKNEITVSAAISLRNAFDEIGKRFEARSATKVVFNYGGSGELMTQITAGAPVDVFASAAQKDMDELAKQHLIDTVSRANFAANSIVLIVPANAGGSIHSFGDLNTERIRTIAVGNPKTVPAGRYAEEVFTYYKLLPAIRGKLVNTENVRQALDYVARGEVDAGVVYATDVIARHSETRTIATAPNASHKEVVYPIAIVMQTPNAAAAHAFIAFVVSTEGQTILQQFGFKPAHK